MGWNFPDFIGQILFYSKSFFIFSQALKNPFIHWRMWIGVEMLYMTICTALGIKGEMMYAPPPLNEMFYNSRMLSGILMKLVNFLRNNSKEWHILEVVVPKIDDLFPHLRLHIGLELKFQSLSPLKNKVKWRFCTPVLLSSS